MPGVALQEESHIRTEGSAFGNRRQRAAQSLRVHEAHDARREIEEAAESLAR
jgi:hypothetical protein